MVYGNFLHLLQFVTMCRSIVRDRSPSVLIPGSETTAENHVVFVQVSAIRIMNNSIGILLIDTVL